MTVQPRNRSVICCNKRLHRLPAASRTVHNDPDFEWAWPARGIERSKAEHGSAASELALERTRRERGCARDTVRIRRRGSGRYEDADVHQGHRADLPGEMRGVP